MNQFVDGQTLARAEVARRERPALGMVLTARGAVTAEAVEAALAGQGPRPARIGDVLIAEGVASKASVARAVAEQHGLGFVDLARTPPDASLADPRDAALYARHRILPWRRIGRVTTYAVAAPDAAARAIAELSDASGRACLVVAEEAAIERAIGRILRGPLTERAAARTAPEHSVRTIPGLRRGAAAALVALCLLILLGGPMAVTAGLMGLIAIEIATAAMRLAALLAAEAWPCERQADGGGERRAGSGARAAGRALPTVSILVPLYREADMIGEIVRALARIDYPRAKLDVRLLLEETDSETRRAVAAADLPRWIRPMVVPDGKPRTKPRAMNYALDFCRGEIVGIFDAEDRPAADQVRRVVAALAAAPPQTACVQCQLTYYNPRENWITRCFHMEYGLWFGIFLHGFQRLGLPIPLGGTSVYFRRDALEAIGGWDAQNVTEDADLGMRLVRAGYRTTVLASDTEEEANCRAGPWIRQRSRWLKGYMLTWLSHMRAPGILWRELGPRRFLGLNVLFLGAVAGFLAMPLFWLATLGWLITGQSVVQTEAPAWMIWPALGAFLLGQGVLLTAAAIEMRRRRALDLLWWLPASPIYWTLGAIAAWKAVIEIAVAPFYWDKTRHGVSRVFSRDHGAAPLARGAVTQMG